MYSTLDAIDIVVTNDQGEKIGVQSDHRSPEEIESNFALSVIFALTRVLGIRRAASDICGVRFHHREKPSTEFMHVLLATGAEVQFGEGESPQSIEEDEEAWALAAQAALRDLGEAVFQRHGVEPSAGGLEQVQQSLWDAVAEAGGKGGNEIAYWTAVAEVGAATGLVVDDLYGGQWDYDPEYHSTIPFLFGCNASEREISLNVFGKAERFFEHGMEQAPTQILVQLKDSMDQELAGKVMFSLKPSTWSLREMAMCHPILKDAQAAEVPEGMPLVAIVRDLPNTTQTFPQDATEEEREQLLEQAHESLEQLEVEVREIDLGFPAILLQGDYYAGEKVLDQDFMKTLHEKMESEVLVVALPVKGMALIAASPETQIAGSLYAIGRGQFRECPEPERISTEIMVFTNGLPSGFVDTTLVDEILDEEEDE